MNRFIVRAGYVAGVVRAVGPFVLGVSSLSAQLVTPKTVPVKQGDQFAIFPSSLYGMGGVTIALDDTLRDPFVNPAKATRVGASLVFATPYFHGVSEGRGGGHTLPVGGFAQMGEWSGAAVFAIQELNSGTGFSRAISDRTAANQYATGVLARRLPGGVSIGASAFVAGLEAVDGVDLMYAGSDRLEQSGTLTDLRLGLTKAWGDARRFDFVLVHNRTRMTQDVHFSTWVWDPVPRTSTLVERTDHNDDRTNIWGAHTQFTRPIGTEGWRLGWLATANRLSHPKIPNYVLQNIPRDPGTTYGYNVGMGLARVLKSSSFGIDLFEQPMFSNTWADAARDTAIVGGGTIKAGERTVENHFRFSNVRMNVGLSHLVATRDSNSVFGFQLGMSVHSIHYRLRQTNNVQRTRRVQDEGWTEWTPTFGVGWRMKDFDIRYSYRRTCGPSDCVGWGGDKVNLVMDSSPTTGGVIAAPSSPLTVDGGMVRAHQLSVLIPIR